MIHTKKTSKTLYFLILFTLAFAVSLVEGCGDTQQFVDYFKHPDTVYVIQYSNNPNFLQVYHEEEMYHNTVDHYPLPPETIDLVYWTGGRPNHYTPPDKNFYYARIVGYCNKKLFWTSRIQFWETHKYTMDDYEKDKAIGKQDSIIDLINSSGTHHIQVEESP